MSKIIKLFFLLFLIGCSYEPILLNKDPNFQFVEITTKGNKKVNELIKNNLSEQNREGTKYNIFINSKKDKEIISSDSKGDPKVFKIKVNVIYDIVQNEEVIISNNSLEEITYNNIKDKLELLKVEENILKTIARKVTNQISISIISKSR
tara:strand:- start:367 stop:816 length:450 start_codon:yes stop_codon:yes gene_type:complete